MTGPILSTELHASKNLSGPSLKFINFYPIEGFVLPRISKYDDWLLFLLLLYYKSIRINNLMIL